MGPDGRGFCFTFGVNDRVHETPMLMLSEDIHFKQPSNEDDGARSEGTLLPSALTTDFPFDEPLICLALIHVDILHLYILFITSELTPIHSSLTIIIPRGTRSAQVFAVAYRH